MARENPGDGWEEKLNALKKDPKTARLGLVALKAYVRQNLYGISGKQVEEWYKQQTVNQLRPSGIFHNSWVPHEAREEFQVDVADMGVHHEDKDRYLLVCVDPFTKYIWAEPSNTKKPEDLAAAFRQILHKMDIPAHVITDMGGEFQKNFEEQLDYFDIEHIRFRTHPAFVERAVRSIKQSLAKTISSITDDEEAGRKLIGWEKFLQNTLEHFNNETAGMGDSHKPSRITKMRPQDIVDELNDPDESVEDHEALRRTIVKRIQQNGQFHQKYVPLKEGDLVKVRAKHDSSKNVQKIEFLTKYTFRILRTKYTTMGRMYELEHVRGEGDWKQIINDPTPAGQASKPHWFLRHDLLKVTESDKQVMSLTPFTNQEKRVRAALQDAKASVIQVLDELKEKYPTGLIKLDDKALTKWKKEVLTVALKNVPNSKITTLSDFFRLFREKFKLYSNNEQVEVRPVDAQVSP